ncbi:hypothetical protein BJ138DRAFT_1098249 [Hygrophoropsis aurantiaca]|uniref:Uncharacterized protein n=1 Tax=Hygrophoropsis aurantiaca TaxID=72124 RepID=A0ACB8AP27_9AGAM|nr:hypothetical protein BJ138DRAFT_1098249 [Hygrophoropsis aurantiaca]
MHLSVLLLCFIYSGAHGRLLYTGPEDLYAFPKHRVTFLNNLPVQNETAERWLHEGLRGGEQEFLDQPWQETSWYSHAMRKEIGSSESQESLGPSKPIHHEQSGYTLEHMKMSEKNRFICLIPPARETTPPTPEHVDPDTALGHSWSLLQPLSGRCLYHRQTWFTYSYCHNQEIKQFRELPRTQPHPPGGYEPVEDPDWESFTLGRAPPAADVGADVAIAEHNAQAVNLEVARGPGSRYLVQRWGDGTFCEKTNKPREVEVQFHCSMTMTDSILLVREAKTCSYVLVVQTPRLCGEPGFKSRLESRDESLIRCRQIVDVSYDSTPSESTQLEQPQHDEHIPISEESDHPSHLAQREPRFAAPTATVAQNIPGEQKDKPLDDYIKQAMAALFKGQDGQASTGDNPRIVVQKGPDGEYFIEILEEIPLDGLDEGDVGADDYAHIAEVLRKAGYDVKGEAEDAKKVPKGNEAKGQGGDDQRKPRKARDEL